MNRYVFVRLRAAVAVVVLRSSVRRAKYQTSWVTASDGSSSDFSALPLSWSACSCASAGSVANVFMVLAGGWPVTVSMLSQASWCETIPFDGRSDYDAFTDAGIPAGGIFAGAEVIKTADQVLLYGGTAGEAFDPCYHQLCDTLENISVQGLREHKNAAVHAIGTFAATTSSVFGTNRASSSSMKPWDWKGDKLVR